MKNFIFLIVLFSIFSSCKKGENTSHNPTGKKGNKLVQESSPYLLQHAYNPVDWHPWNDEVIEHAKNENKMLIISIGYAACHWCHVMEHESFEDSLVARIMNENFICIKVDREERPDVDDVYMTACQLASGSGCGWPLNAFAMPDGRPVWAGTYFPKDQWLKILNQFIKLKNDTPEKLEENAKKITQGIHSSESITIKTSNSNYTIENLNQLTDDFEKMIDFTHGGKKGAPKFPMPNNYEFLLQSYFLTGNEKALKAAQLTLNKMANGGLYDQLGGGFARYSTDEIWLAPHFEKMLYDNGQLVSLYSHAFQLTKNPLYQKIVEETTRFVERELMNNQFGFYSSLDADSEGEEGKFYVWQETEIDALFPDPKKATMIKDYYSIKEHGNWEESNILYINEKFDLQKHGMSKEEFEEVLQNAKQKLFEERTKRTRPGLDDKILTSWNGLMLKGYIDAYRAIGNEHYKEIALKNAEFLLKNNLQPDGHLNRSFKDGKSTINGFLDDYATTIDAFIALYEVSFDVQWLNHASKLTQYTIDHFFNEDNKMFFYTSDLDPALIARKMVLADNVISSSNSMMARNLYKLGTINYDEEKIKMAKQMLANMEEQMNSGQPNFYSNWCQLQASMINPPFEVAVLGDVAIEKALEIQKNYLPNAFFLGGKSEGKMELLKDKLQEGRTMIYVCQNKVCKLPVEDVEKAIPLIK